MELYRQNVNVTQTCQSAWTGSAGLQKQHNYSHVYLLANEETFLADYLPEMSAFPTIRFLINENKKVKKCFFLFLLANVSSKKRKKLPQKHSWNPNNNFQHLNTNKLSVGTYEKFAHPCFIKKFTFGFLVILGITIPWLFFHSLCSHFIPFWWSWPPWSLRYVLQLCKMSTRSVHIPLTVVFPDHGKLVLNFPRDFQQSKRVLCVQGYSATGRGTLN